MPSDLELLRTIERAPLRTMRYADLAERGTNVWRQLDRLVEAGAITRLAKGAYTAPPEGADGRQWKPTLEIAGLAVATARVGNRNAVLMGLGAARFYAAIPRAIGVTTVAIPADAPTRPPVELEHGGKLMMIPRDLDKLDAMLVDTELGAGLVATPAQTLYDMLMRPKQGGMPDEAAAAAQNLRGQVSASELESVVREHMRSNDAVRQVVIELQESVRRGG